MIKKNYYLLFVIIFFITLYCEAIDKNNNIKENKVEETLSLIRNIRKQALSTLLKLEKKYKKGKKHAEIVLRIAELYYEKAKELEEKEIKTYDLKLAKYHKTRKGKEPVLDNSSSKRYLFKSVKAYKNLINNYPRHHMLDKAYFNLAFNFKELGKNTTSVAYFHKMIKLRPNSNLIPDAYLNIGEYHFDKNQWDQAKYNYEKVTSFRNINTYGYANYKLAWTYYNMKDYSAAMRSLEEVVRYGRSPASSYTSKRIELIKESLKDLVLFYSETGTRAAAKDYFLKIGGKEDYVWMLERLAKIYIDNGDHANAIAIYKELIDIDRYFAKNPDWTLAIVNSYETMGNTTKMMEYLNNLIKNYHKDSSWYEFHIKNPDVLKASYGLRESTIRAHALKHHKTARKQQRSQLYDMAAELYSKYLTYFPEDKHSYELRYFYAELFFEQQKFIQAAEQYAIVRDDIRDTKFLEKTAYNVIFSYESKIKEYEYLIASNTQSKKKLKKKIKEVEEKEIIACDKYVEKVPKGKDIINIKYKAANLLYKHKRYEEARPRLAHVAETYPTNKNAEFAVHLMLDSFNVEKNWLELNKWARRFYGNKILVAQGKLAQELYLLIVDSSFKICLDYEKEHKYEIAANKFKEFSEEFPKEKLTKEAILNSARNYENADILISAIQMHIKFLKTYTRAKETSKVLKSLAVNHEKIGYITIAAKYYDKLAGTYPNDPDSEKASYNVAYFYELAGKLDLAEDAYLRFLKKYPRSQYGAEAIYALIEIQHSFKDKAKEEKYMRMYIAASHTKPDNVVEVMVKLGKALALDNKLKEASKYYKNAIAYYTARKKKLFIAGTRSVAEAQFLLANMHNARFDAVKLVLPKSKMIKNMTTKIKYMKSMNNEYAKVFDYGPTEFAIAAQYKIGSSFEELSNSLFNAPMPRNMTTDEIQAFKAELEEVAYPIEEKAIKAFEANIEKAEELRLGRKWARLSYEKMYKYKSKDFPMDLLESTDPYLESGTIYKVD